MSATDSLVTARLAPRPQAAMHGLTFWDQAGARAQQPPWQLALLREWVAHPDRILTFHVDRGTEVIVNGMKGTLADIHPGDRVGVEIRPQEQEDEYWPYFIRVYRYR